MINHPFAGDVFGDSEQAALIERLPLDMTYSDVAMACVARFGAGRAWPRQKIMDYWLSNRPKHGPWSAADRNPELACFIEDRAWRQTVDEIRAAAIAKFGAERVPSRSTIGLYVQRIACGSRSSKRAGGGWNDAEVKRFIAFARAHFSPEEIRTAIPAIFGKKRAASLAMIRDHLRSKPRRKRPAAPGPGPAEP